MNSAEVAHLVGQLSAVDVSANDVESCTRVLHDLSHVFAWAEAGKGSVATRLTGLAVASPTILPEHVLADATRVSLDQGLQPFKRALRAMYRGWQFHLTADRTLTIALPDGTTQCHGPPQALAA